MKRGDERSFGYLLRRSRLAALLTQEQLAERAHLSYRTISDLERGAKHTPRRDTVLLLAHALQLTPQERATLIAAIQPRDQQPEAYALPDDQASSKASVRAFIIADVRWYTAFHERGDDAAARLADRFAALTKAVVVQRDGEVLQLRGDDALAVFEAPRQALNASLDQEDRVKQETEEQHEPGSLVI